MPLDGRTFARRRPSIRGDRGSPWTLGLHLRRTPSDAGGVALYLTAPTPLVVGEPILVPVRLSTDSRGRPMPLGAIQQVDPALQVLKAILTRGGGPFPLCPIFDGRFRPMAALPC